MQLWGLSPLPGPSMHRLCTNTMLPLSGAGGRSHLLLPVQQFSSGLFWGKTSIPLFQQFFTLFSIPHRNHPCARHTAFLFPSEVLPPDYQQTNQRKSGLVPSLVHHFTSPLDRGGASLPLAFSDWWEMPHQSFKVFSNQQDGLLPASMPQYEWLHLSHWKSTDTHSGCQAIHSFLQGILVESTGPRVRNLISG